MLCSIGERDEAGPGEALTLALAVETDVARGDLIVASDNPVVFHRGKSTIAPVVEQKLHARGHHTYMLDGDNVRNGLNRNLGFTNAVVENIRRFVDASLDDCIRRDPKELYAKARAGRIKNFTGFDSLTIGQRSPTFISIRPRILPMDWVSRQ